MTLSVRAIIVLISSVTLLGCAQITVTRVDPSAAEKPLKGVRYSLPKPYVQVTPAPDGGVDADIIFLPDPDNTYVIEAKDSFIASYTFTTGLSNGLLTSVGWTADTTGVATSALPVAGAVGQKILDTQVATETTRTTNIATAKKALEDANLGVQIAIAKLNLAVANGADAGTILSLKQALQEAVLRRDAAQKDLDALLGQKTSTNTPAEIAAIAGTSETAEAPGMTAPKMRIYGPILYAVNERRRNGTDTVELRAARPQDSFPTVFAPTTQPTPVLYPQGVESLAPDKDGKILLLMVPSTAIVSLVGDAQLQTLDQNGNVTNTRSFPIALESSTSLKAELSTLPKGSYQLLISFQYGDPKRPTTLSKPAAVRFDINK